ncbi:hypothetical protein Sjap_012029 [Stephania japonica]|uniref:Uncharacterized protein n=1 Tax=Stephania japonica TaxID=461633 RepID=A0AAP0P581_9MAGN
MAHKKVHPNHQEPPSCTNSSHQYCMITTTSSSEKEIFTIWMKSLVMNSNGCTVFDSNGRVIYRVDNYDSKGREEVHLMDLKGNTLSTIIKKKFRLFGRWEGFRFNSSANNYVESMKTPWFQVRKHCTILKGKPQYCEVKVSTDHDQQQNKYKIERLEGKFTFRIVDQEGCAVAEVKQKQTSSGVGLGDDVLTLVVEPNVDHLLVVGLLIVCGLIKRKL